MSRITACLYLASAMALVGANVPIGKAIIAEMPIYLFAFFRFAIASVALSALIASEPGTTLRQLAPRQRRNLVLMSLIGMVGFTILILEGLKRTSATDAGIITASLPAAVALLGVVFFRDRLSRHQIFAIGLAIIGLALIQVTSFDGNGRSAFGNVLVIGAVICEALFVILAKGLSTILKPVRLALSANLVGLILTLPLALPDLLRFDITEYTPLTIALAVWYALAASVFALLLWYRGLPHVETATAGLFTAALPLTALAVSATFLGETIGATQLFGAALVIAAIWLGAGALRRPAL